VDRGEPGEPQRQRVLAFYFARREEGDAAWLAEQASAIRTALRALLLTRRCGGSLRSQVA
jgi:hypothetical protein